MDGPLLVFATAQFMLQQNRMHCSSFPSFIYSWSTYKPYSFVWAVCTAQGSKIFFVDYFLATFEGSFFNFS